MGLFSVSSRPRSSRYSLSTPRRTRRSRHRCSESNRDTFSVDIGEPELLCITVENSSKFILLSDSEASVCLRVSYSDDSRDEVMVIRWADTQRDVNSRDHIASFVAKSAVQVPAYRVKEVLRHHGKYVSIGIRNYIDGCTLKSSMPYLSQEEMDAILLQIEAITWQLASKKSAYFGHIQDGPLRTATPAAYIRTRILFDKLSGAMDASDFMEEGTDKYRCDAVMCHGNLTPEHIILSGATVVGVVGWSKGDFVPEVYDRLVYYFNSNPNDPKCWNRRMSEMMSSAASREPSVEFVINTTTYLYKSTWLRSTRERRSAVNRLWKSITTNYTVVNCISTATETDSDSMSLSSLTSWSESSKATILADE